MTKGTLLTYYLLSSQNHHFWVSLMAKNKAHILCFIIMQFLIRIKLFYCRFYLLENVACDHRSVFSFKTKLYIKLVLVLFLTNMSKTKRFKSIFWEESVLTNFPRIYVHYAQNKKVPRSSQRDEFGWHKCPSADGQTEIDHDPNRLLYTQFIPPHGLFLSFFFLIRLPKKSCIKDQGFFSFWTCLTRKWIAITSSNFYESIQLIKHNQKLI